ncbi:MAG: ribonuclease P protein component [Acidobacteria bacterium]|nr:ribonuclease P protein component [Acidobacteriota bacterium]
MLGTTRLRNAAEFRSVYVTGKRYDGHFITIFMLSNDLNQHRLGITTSRKMAKNSVDRNRSKRLLRETFRLSHSALMGLQGKYDWVFNARRSLLEVKVISPLEEFQEIIARIKRSEHLSSSESCIKER